MYICSFLNYPHPDRGEICIAVGEPAKRGEPTVKKKQNPKVPEGGQPRADRSPEIQSRCEDEWVVGGFLNRVFRFTPPRSARGYSNLSPPGTCKWLSREMK